MTTAWLIYIAACIGLMLLVWYASKDWRPVLVWRVLRVWIAAILLVPGVGQGEEPYLAPAWIMAGFGLGTGDTDLASAGTTPLLAGLVLSLLVIIAGFIVEKRKNTEQNAG